MLQEQPKRHLLKAGWRMYAVAALYSSLFLVLFQVTESNPTKYKLLYFVVAVHGISTAALVLGVVFQLTPVVGFECCFFRGVWFQAYFPMTVP